MVEVLTNELTPAQAERSRQLRLLMVYAVLALAAWGAAVGAVAWFDYASRVRQFVVPDGHGPAYEVPCAECPPFHVELLDWRVLIVWALSMMTALAAVLSWRALQRSAAGR